MLMKLAQCPKKNIKCIAEEHVLFEFTAIGFEAEPSITAADSSFRLVSDVVSLTVSIVMALAFPRSKLYPESESQA